MRRLILQTGISLDGYVAALDGSHPWDDEVRDEAVKRWILESVSAAGAHLMGRVTYEEMAAFWPTSDERFRTADERDPESRLLEDPASWRLGRDARRRRRPRRGDRASQARAGQRPDRVRRRRLGPGAFTARAGRRVPADGPPGGTRHGLPLFKDLPAPLQLELIEATTLPDGLAIHVYRPRGLRKGV